MGNNAEHTVVKSGDKGKQRRENEAAVLRLAEQLGLPTPRVRELKECVIDGKSEILIRMDNIEGQTLKTAWLIFSPYEKHDVYGQLRDILDEMRAKSDGLVPP
ncbi:hypothetical protein BU24DRAFT_481385 [Aaosphaeria arxii CBS 175.79]|uniref:Uncharacterized protein n=1 Tax=Aaosphaeria arxii CBS 175.79 TaxID=1450172 RepID=A0A6A5XVP1_9PLEO|nr:uncharacterized protein BU24DRAFT_481385 [Aaosphaeria arxii CBS 175.79]KAF2016781.1 hypothetical protein BU24DRAFT_481385 [Aaosphaeria arxii CBS 175.79]